MNKNNKILPPIIAFILSIIIGQVILWIINRTELDIIANMLEVLISILNFIFVIYIFKNDQKYREEEKRTPPRHNNRTGKCGRPSPYNRFRSYYTLFSFRKQEKRSIKSHR